MPDAPYGHRDFTQNLVQHREGSEQEAELANRLRREHVYENGQLPSTQTYRDPTQEEVLRRMTRGIKKLKIVSTDEDNVNTTVFFTANAASELITHLAKSGVIRPTKSRQGWRVFTQEEKTPTANVAKQTRSEGF